MPRQHAQWPSHKKIPSILHRLYEILVRERIAVVRTNDNFVYTRIPWEDDSVFPCSRVLLLVLTKSESYHSGDHVMLRRCAKHFSREVKVRRIKIIQNFPQCSSPPRPSLPYRFPSNVSSFRYIDIIPSLHDVKHSNSFIFLKYLQITKTTSNSFLMEFNISVYIYIVY